MTHPVQWLHRRGFLDDDQIQAFDGFQALVETSQAWACKSAHFGRVIVDGGRSRLTHPEAAANARERLRRALKTLEHAEQLVLIAVTMGKSISEIERQLKMRPRTAKYALQGALTTLHAEWRFFDRRVNRQLIGTVYGGAA